MGKNMTSGARRLSGNAVTLLITALLCGGSAALIYSGAASRQISNMLISMACYIGMGWAVIPFAKQTLEAMGVPGFLLLLLGGIAYTVGSVLYGLGKTKKWMHSVFHIFVVLGAVLQYFAVLLYAI